MIVVKDWIRQLGSTAMDSAHGIAVDGRGNLYVAGRTYGDLAGPSAGRADAWLARYDAEGVQQWIEQLGSTASDFAHGIAVDGSGDVYVAGITWGELKGGTGEGVDASEGDDAWLAKYDAEGVQQWIEQLGSSVSDFAHDIAVDSRGNVYVAGRTSGELAGRSAGREDAWLASYDAEGVQRWIEQLGSSAQDSALGVAVDGRDNVYVAGQTQDVTAGSRSTTDAWLARYDAQGVQQWIEQLGSTVSDSADGIAVDGSGNVYVAGRTFGALEGRSAGRADAWLASYDPEGVRRWIEQLGTATSDSAHGIAVDGSGNVYVAGMTSGALGRSAGREDAWLASYDAEGVQRWIEQLGTAASDSAHGIAVDGRGNVYVAGQTSGELEGSSVGSDDAWFAKYHQEFESIGDATPLLLSMANNLATLDPEIRSLREQVKPIDDSIVRAESIEGSWKRSEVITKGGPGAGTNSSPQASVMIFGKGHYSFMYVPGKEPRKLHAGSGPGTDAEKIESYDSFVANAGTYEVAGAKLTVHPHVARVPNFMTGDNSVTYDLEFDGDALWLTSTRGDVESRVKLTRLE